MRVPLLFWDTLYITITKSQMLSLMTVVESIISIRDDPYWTSREKSLELIDRDIQYKQS